MSTQTLETKETQTTESIGNGKATKHPLGDMIKCKVHCLGSAEKKHSIYVSINQFSFDFQQNVEIQLPRGVVKFLQEATKPGYIVNEKGYYETVNEPLYAVTTLV